MTEVEQPSEAPILQYATPQDRHGRPAFAVFVGILGIGVGLFGTLALLGAVWALVEILTEPGRLDFGLVVALPVFLVIGIVGCLAALRWCRAVPGIFSGNLVHPVPKAPPSDETPHAS